MSSSSASTLAIPSFETAKGWGVEEVEAYLRSNQTKFSLNNNEIERIRDDGYNGSAFLNITKDKLLQLGLRGGPTTNIIKFVIQLNSQNDGPPRKHPRLVREDEEPMKWLEQSKDIPNIVINGNYVPGISEFSGFIKSGIFVDKSLFIMEFMVYGKKANLITRPHQFGKSTNLSMLHAFLAPSLTEGERTQKLNLFKGLRISKFEWFMKLHFGNWPIIHISFKDLNNKSWQLMLNSLGQRMSKLYENYRYILDDKKLSDTEENFFKKILNGTTDESYLIEALSSLAKYLYTYYDKCSIILIDDYDWPMEHTEKINYDDINSLFQFMYSSIAKDNEYVYKILFVGLLPLDQANFLSGLNNVEHYPMHILRSVHGRAYFSDMFGFTEEEVKFLLKKSKLNVELNKVRSYYNGYQTSTGIHIYNPHSVIKFLEKRIIKNYWINNSSAVTLIKCLKKCNQDIKRQLQNLFYSFYPILDNDSLSLVKAQLIPYLRYDILEKELKIDAIYTLLYYSGYLSVKTNNSINDKSEKEVVEQWGDNTTVELIIPNREVAEQWRQWIFEIIGIQ
ncbi:hypothetical protein C1645_857259 [Glomus cerebriforme]|uniref:AAA-ATPase-like domain-containing protein n=1 Tax=Glomus cerebriforme TaxID=658196 RepID=A0A397SLQ1_9GLOM|nr:hypothetical protein C1645_857259 [Glomus cerebriforme]